MTGIVLMSDPVITAIPVRECGERLVDSVSAEARANRDILARALTSAGFVNYPTEWWHWSCGDRYWALGTSAPAARYGPASRGPGAQGLGTSARPGRECGDGW